MERINGRIAVAWTKPEEPYKKTTAQGMPNRSLMGKVCKDVSNCSGCVSYKVCEFGKEAVRRGLMK